MTLHGDAVYCDPRMNFCSFLGMGAASVAAMGAYKLFSSCAGACGGMAQPLGGY